MTERGSLFSAERRELIEDVGTFVCSLVAIAVYFMCAFVDAPCARDSRPYHTTERTTSWASIISL